MIGADPRLFAFTGSGAGKPLQPGVKTAQIAQVGPTLRFPPLGKCLRQFIAAPRKFSMAGELPFCSSGTL